MQVAIASNGSLATGTTTTLNPLEQELNGLSPATTTPAIEVPTTTPPTTAPISVPSYTVPTYSVPTYTVPTYTVPTYTVPTYTAPTVPPTTAPTTAELVEQWYGSYGGIISTLEDDYGSVADTTMEYLDDDGSLGTIGSACQQLESDATSAQSLPAIPDTSIESPWSSAVSDSANAGESCVAGVDDLDAAAIQTANQEIMQATSELNQTTAAVNALYASS